jgi:hemolysin type calcium-binding protein/Big-like domain-containing protein/HYR domain-containing protein
MAREVESLRVDVCLSNGQSESRVSGGGLKRRRNVGLLVLSVVGILAIGPSCTPAPPKTDDTWDCTCGCDDACTNAEVAVLTGPDGNSFATCTASKPGFPVFPGTIPQTLKTCVVPGASQAVIDAACTARCADIKNKSAVSPKGLTIPVDGVPGSPLAATRLCRFEVSAANERQESTATCKVSSGSFSATAALVVAAPEDGAAIQMTSSSSVIATIPHEDSSPDIVVLPPPTGQVLIAGGNCPNRSCPISLQIVALRVPGFVVQFTSVDDVSVTNTDAMVGTKDQNGQITFPASSLNVMASALMGGVRQIGLLNPSPGLTGFYSPTTGALQLNGNFTDGSQGIAFNLTGQATARPPIVTAGVDQVVACSANGPASVTLNGTGTFDPDGDALTVAWSENGTVLAHSLIATVALNNGQHTIALTATDATGRSSQRFVNVSVTDNVPPVFTFVPPPVAVETPGPVSFGQARATDACGGPVTITNNAPGSFPIGKTTITWKAVDASGNSTTATQFVFVFPPTAASCPTTGYNIILGTSNNDVLVGTDGRDCIVGFGGQDRIDGKGGDDILIGGDGDDIIVGGTGNDIIVGGTGQDTLSDVSGNDVLIGGDGDDLMSGGDGDDILIGGNGQDHMDGGNGNDLLVGNAGDDSMQGGAGTDRCVADLDHDTLLSCEVP